MNREQLGEFIKRTKVVTATSAAPKMKKTLVKDDITEHVDAFAVVALYLKYGGQVSGELLRHVEIPMSQKDGNYATYKSLTQAGQDVVDNTSQSPAIAKYKELFGIARYGVKHGNNKGWDNAHQAPVGTATNVIRLLTQLPYDMPPSEVPKSDWVVQRMSRTSTPSLIANAANSVGREVFERLACSKLDPVVFVDGANLLDLDFDPRTIMTAKVILDHDGYRYGEWYQAKSAATKFIGEEAKQHLALVKRYMEIGAHKTDMAGITTRDEVLRCINDPEELVTVQQAHEEEMEVRRAIAARGHNPDAVLAASKSASSPAATEAERLMKQFINATAQPASQGWLSRK